jgi:hypothetical protein
MLPIIVSMRVTMALVGVKWMPVVVFLELISSAGDLSVMISACLLLNDDDRHVAGACIVDLKPLLELGVVFEVSA